jgi:hypothetical protein
MWRPVGVRPKPVPMLSRHVLRRLTVLMDVQQRGLLQSEHQSQTKRNRQKGPHQPPILG